jgi:acyl-coenzyme A synthetase/AMP-(fatty) acid ligase
LFFTQPPQADERRRDTHPPPPQLINRGGEKISPIELDSAILSLQGVAEAVSFGVPDVKYGEKVWAMVVLEQGVKEDEEALKKALEKKVAKVRSTAAERLRRVEETQTADDPPGRTQFKIPERIIFTSAIPK